MSIIVHTEAFQLWLLPNSPHTQKIPISFCLATKILSFWKCAEDIKHTCTQFSSKRKYSCQLTDCHLLAQLNPTSLECNFLSDDGEGWFLAYEDVGEGWWSVLRMLAGDCSIQFLMCTPYYTSDLYRQKFGLRMIGMLLALSASCIFAALCFSALNLRLAFPIDERRLSQSKASCCHDWWLIPICAGSCVQLIFVMLSWIMLSFLELSEEECFGHAYIFHLCDMASQEQLNMKHNGLYAGRMALLRTSSFDTLSCHFMPRVESMQHWWNHSSSLICFW